MASRRLIPGILNTTLHPSAIGETRAAAILNCDTTRGIWELDDRYRKFKRKPTRMATSGGIQDLCTEAVYATSVAAVAAVDATKFFSSPTNARVSDDFYAFASGLEAGDKTDSLYAFPFIPNIAIPDAATDLVATIRIEAHTEPDTDVVTPIVDHEVYLTVDGAEVGDNLATGDPIGTEDLAREYEVDLVALAITPEMIADGRIGVRARWKAVPDTLYDPADYSLAYTATGQKTVNGVVTAWAGAPPFSAASGLHDPVPVSAREAGTIHIEASGPDAQIVIEVTADTEGYASALSDYPEGGAACEVILTDSLGGSQDQTGAVTQTASLSTTKKVWVTVSGGDGTYDVDVDAQGITTVSVNGLGHCTAMATASAIVSLPDPADILVDAFTLTVCYTIDDSTEYEIEGAGGIGFGTFGGVDEVAVVWGRGAFDVPAGDVADAADADWSDQRASAVLATGPWSIWQFAKWLFYASPDDGVYYRSIGLDDWTPLYKDSQSPGSTGDATAVNSVPPYDDYAVLDSALDTTADDSSGGSTAAASIDAGTGLSQIVVSGADGWAEITIILNASVDISKSDALYFQIAAGVNDQTQDGFRTGAANNYIRLESSTTPSANITTIVKGRVDVRSGDYRAWADISGVSSAILSAVEKIVIRFGTYMYKNGADYQIRSIKAGGVRYHNSAGAFKDDTTANTASVQYAYWYDEVGQPDSAKSLVVAPSVHLGTIPYAALPYLGSVLTVTVPLADAPFSGAATIKLARKVGTDWQVVATGPNSEDLVFIDSLRDSVVAADTGTYPVVTPDFGDFTPSDSGTPSGIVCGCAWKGSNIYSGEDGKIYMSRTNDGTEVLWDDVVLTNDAGSEDLGPPRTSVLADNTSDYAICLVPAENLYCFTKRECYVFVAGETAYEASFPRKVDGVRGALGVRSACVYGDRALVGSVDGLWLVKKASEQGEQPDELIEVTKENRGAWSDFLDATPETVVVRQRLGHIWCFNGNRYYHITREGRHIPGQWADGAEVVDAVGDPYYGLLVQLSTGPLGVIGDYPSDGGEDVDGEDGTAPRWSYTTGTAETGADVKRADIWASTEADQIAVQIQALTEGGTDTVYLTGSPSGIVSKPYDRLPGGGRLGGAWSKFVISGGAQDLVSAAVIDLVERDVTRGER